MQNVAPSMLWSVLAIMAILLILTVFIISVIAANSKKIRKSEQKFKTLYERVFDALFLVDGNWRIVDVNDSACSMLGVAKDQIVMQHITDLIAESMRPQFHEDIARAFKGEPLYLGEFELVGDAEKAVHAEVGCTGLEIQDQYYLLASFRDITLRKQAEAELRKKNIALKGVLASVEEEKIKIKKQLAGAFEHNVLPSVEKLVNLDGTVNAAYFRLLKESLRDMSSLSVDMGDAMNKLSPREMEICKLTERGSSAKEIAEALSITVATVEKHKENIRKKLKISNKKINLATHLNNLTGKTG